MEIVQLSGGGFRRNQIAVYRDGTLYVQDTDYADWVLDYMPKLLAVIADSSTIPSSLPITYRQELVEDEVAVAMGLSHVFPESLAEYYSEEWRTGLTCLA